MPFLLEDDIYMLSLHIYEFEYLLSALEIASDIAVCEGDNQRALILEALLWWSWVEKIGGIDNESIIRIQGIKISSKV